MDWIKQKKSYLEKLLDIVKRKRDETHKHYKDAQERANEAEGAMISRYDTFKEEGQYLAEGLKIKYHELRTAALEIESILKDIKLKESDLVQHYSIVAGEFDTTEEFQYFISPYMGGEKIDMETTIVSPSSPIGKSLFGKREDDQFEFIVDKKVKKGEITFVV